MLSVLKWIGGPGSIGFLALCCAIGLALRAAGAPRIGRVWLLSVYIGYIVAGLPIVANSIASRLSHYRPLDDLTAVRSADALIVLHGDNVRGRVREARRVFGVTNPPVILVSGPPSFTELIVDSGIPRQRLVIDTRSSNTLEQVTNLARFVRDQRVEKPVLIASRLQMPRIAELIRAQRVDVFLAPSEIDDEPPIRGALRFVPMYEALRVTRDAVYEHIAIRYYRQKAAKP